ncbi:aspartyl-phosphate phosphatase Spo0E family protein [Terrilactibacillus sp. S3-3]|nr:aspartyl-phosphate phosphatase Spo0E family protein [Terrilactibacillus sp. S3-3]
MDKDQLRREIEKARHQLVYTAGRHPLSSPTVIRVSCRLDRLLNKYEQLIK